jgi:hypothetical protein
VSTIRFIAPPDWPKDGAPPCVMCVMVAKLEICERYKDKIEAARKNGVKGDVWIPYPADVKIYAGEFRALSGELPMLGVTDLCFSHCAGFDMTPGSGAGLALPNGARRGRG